MNTLTEAISTLKLSEQSCRDEASGKLDDSHNLAEGMQAIEGNLADVRRFLARLNRRRPAANSPESVLKEFIADIQAVGVSAVREQMDWPDLAITYEKALKVLPRRSVAAPTTATAEALAAARAEAVGLCPKCDKLPEWFNDVPLRAFCWGTDEKPHSELSAIVPLPHNPYLTPSDKVPQRIFGWKTKPQMEKIRPLFIEKQKSKIEQDGMLGLK